MEMFLDFLTENYIYFLIAAGVLTLALMGLIVSSKKKGNEGPGKTEVQNVEPFAEPLEMKTEPVVPEVQSIPTPEVVPTPTQVEPIGPVNVPVSEPTFNTNAFVTPTNVEPVEELPREETLNFAGNNAPVNNMDVPMNNMNSPVQETPAIIDTPSTPTQTYDEPIMQIDQTTNNNFQIDGNNSNNNM